MQPKLYHAGIHRRVCRSTLADANETRDWRICADFAQVLIATARRLYAQDDFGVALKQTAYAFDSTTIDLCLAFFIIRAKNNLDCKRRESRPVDRATGLRSDQTIILCGPKTAQEYPQPLRRVRYRNQLLLFDF